MMLHGCIHSRRGRCRLQLLRAASDKDRWGLACRNASRCHSPALLPPPSSLCRLQHAALGIACTASSPAVLSDEVVVPRGVGWGLKPRPQGGSQLPLKFSTHFNFYVQYMYFFVHFINVEHIAETTIYWSLFVRPRSARPSVGYVMCW